MDDRRDRQRTASADPLLRPEDSLTFALWGSATDVFDRILAHPFLLALSDGTLDPDRFVHFLTQDTHYLTSYEQCLLTLAGRAPDEGTRALLTSHADGVGIETALHAELAASLGADWAVASEVAASPTTEAYRNALLRSAALDPFLDGLVALLPCYWIYARVGDHLLRTGSPHPVYARWIDNYSGGEFEQAVIEVLDLVDTLGRRADLPALDHARALYRRGSQYEWMFWDACYRQETWPV